ncbi:hypothetical protein RI367_002277 [Sorochytrium milnesiophthora]
MKGPLPRAFLEFRTPFYASALLSVPPQDAAPDAQYVVVCGGGGDTKSGVKNKLCLLRCDDGATNIELVYEEVFSTNYDAPNALAAHPKKAVVACDVKPVREPWGDNLRFYTVGREGFEYMDSAQTIDHGKEDDYQSSAAFSQDGAYLATGSSEGKLCIVKHAAKQQSVSTIDLGGAIYSVMFTREARHVVSVTPKRVVAHKLQDGKLGDLELDITAPVGGEFRSGKFDPEMKHFYTLVNMKGKKPRTVLTMWDVFANRSMRDVTVSAARGVGMSISSGNIAIITADRCILFYATNTLRQLGQHSNVHDMPVTGLIHINGGAQVVSTGTDGFVKIWDVKKSGGAAVRVLSVVLSLLLLLVITYVTSLAVLEPSSMRALGIPVVEFHQQRGLLLNGDKMPYTRELGLDHFIQRWAGNSESTKPEKQAKKKTPSEDAIKQRKKKQEL